MPRAHREGISGRAGPGEPGQPPGAEGTSQPPTPRSLQPCPSQGGGAHAQGTPNMQKKAGEPHGGSHSGTSLALGTQGERNHGAGPFPGKVLAASPRHGEQPWRRGSSTAEHLSTALLSSRGRHCAGRGGVWSTWLLQPLRISDASPDRAAIPPPKRGVLLSPRSGSGRGGVVSPTSERGGTGRAQGWMEGWRGKQWRAAMAASTGNAK